MCYSSWFAGAVILNDSIQLFLIGLKVIFMTDELTGNIHASSARQVMSLVVRSQTQHVLDNIIFVF